MNIYGSKFFISFLSLLILANTALALDNEFKNSLMGVNIQKDSTGVYEVVVHTQKKFNEPLKVIKKNDLSYYILLPETKNSQVKMLKNSQDIKSITANSFSYAGQEDSNGYTKITINTTKPLNFSVNSTTMPFEVTTKKEPVVHQVTKIAQEKPKNVQQPVNLLDKKEVSSTKANEYVEKTLEPTRKKIKNTTKLASQSVKETNKRIEKKIKAKELVRKQRTIKEEQKSFDEIIEQNEILLAQEAMAMAAAKISEYDTLDVPETQKTELEELPEIEFLENIDTGITNVQENVAAKTLSAYKIAKRKIKTLKRLISEKLADFGLSFNEFCFVVAVFFSAILLIGLIFGRRKNPDLKLAKRSDLIQKIDKKNKLTQDDIVVNKEDKNNENNGQYFIFSDNVRQTGFCDPSTSALEKSYELSSYDPELALKYNKLNDDIDDDKNGEEFEIINKILKDDTYIEIIPDEFNPSSNSNSANKIQNKQSNLMIKKETQQITGKETSREKIADEQGLNKNPYFTPIEKEKEQKATQQQKEEEILEAPKEISSVEIVPGRGFMCVKYGDNVHLMGYIFDDVYALYNFKKPYLENSRIQYRVGEKSEKFVDYMVRVENVKLVISVSNAGMKLKTVM